MKIDGAVAKPGENTPRHDFGRHERDEPGPPKQIGVQGGQIGAGPDWYDRQKRIVPKQHGRQYAALGRTRNQNDSVEHAFHD
jgi:hypothetical protein